MDELWDLLGEETRQSFSDLQNLVLALDGKASTILAIDAILLTAFSLIPNIIHFNLVYRILIFIPLLFSVFSAICCLHLRGWDVMDADKLITEYNCATDADVDVSCVACEIVKTRADLFAKLLKIQKSKSRYLYTSECFTLFALVVGFGVIIFLFFGLWTP